MKCLKKEETDLAWAVIEKPRSEENQKPLSSQPLLNT
jgi:hypothetical protein